MPVITALVVAVAIIVGFSAHIITKKPNSTVEEMAEKVIKIETGIDVKFSPDDKDLNNHKPD